MSNSTFLTIILLCIVVAILAIGKNRMKYKKGIMFSITSIMLPAILFAAVLGVFIGARGLVHFTWAAPLLLIATTLSYEIVSRKVQKPLDEMFKTIDALSVGDVEVEIDENHYKEEHELALILRKTSNLADELKHIALFADQIGKGNLSVEHRLLGDKDVLGMALMDMRANILKSEAEKEERRLEDERRSWVTQGVAKFAELLRENNDNMEELCYSVISNMVKYVGANQGGIFLLNEDSGKPVLELTACYAFERRKYNQKTIDIGEGLVGTCYLERESIYMTDVPQGYINITSGLGDETPRALLIAPLKVNDDVYGVVEIAGFKPFEPHVREFVEKEAESIASTIGAVKVNLRTNELLDKSKIQAEELANQEEELRQNMEEMQATQEEMLNKQRETEQAHEELTKVMAENDYQLTKYTLLIKAANIGLWDMRVVKGDPVNPNNTFEWSESFRQLVGYSEEEFPNVLHSWSDRLHPSDKERTLDAFSRHLLDRTGNTPYDLEYRLLKKNGEYAHFHAFGATTRDENGFALRVAGAIQDITEAKIAEHEKETDTIRLQLLQKSIDIALWDMIVDPTDPTGASNAFWWSPEFRKLLGFTDERDFPNVLHSWSDRLHPEDKDKTLNAFSAHLTDATGNTPYHVKYRLQRKSGEYVWFKADGNTLRDKNGTPIRVVGSVEEIKNDVS